MEDDQRRYSSRSSAKGPRDFNMDDVGESMGTMQVGKNMADD